MNRQIEIKPGDLRCPRCFAKDVVHSMPRGIVDAVMRKFDRVPRHCRACGKRFYVGAESQKKADAEASA